MRSVVISLQEKLNERDDLLLSLQQQENLDYKQRLDIEMKISIYKETLETLGFSEDSYNDDSNMSIAISCLLVNIGLMSLFTCITFQVDIKNLNILRFRFNWRV
ncbi:hypothetical protein KP509_25G002400 [Ceratopteris richardii]|uniref:Uncharacterized protein n=1 Tax=Ceratopteris richardii TaxID=49495 RepID=A0A8T2RP63_CERRI|nr:hypothetical protein KP509_25G002400 [Ceratopteris richardii]